MEQLLIVFGHKLLLTTAADRSECQALEWWDQAEVIISVSPEGLTVLSPPGTRILAGVAEFKLTD